jgi:hypothetical protein
VEQTTEVWQQASVQTLVEEGDADHEQSDRGPAPHHAHGARPPLRGRRRKKRITAKKKTAKKNRTKVRRSHRETEAHFTAAGMSSQRNHSDSFCFKRAAFYQSLKSKVGLAAAKSGVVEDWHSSSPSARSLSRSPSPPPPSFTQSHFPPRSLVRDGQTSPHRPRLVVSRSTCPPLSPSPHANSFILGTAVINTHTRWAAFFYRPTGRPRRTARVPHADS